MRSPYPLSGRPALLEKVWQSITAFTRALVPGQQRSLVTSPNSQYPNDVTTLQRQYDLEISEYPVRDYLKAKQLIEINEYCPEAATARDIIRKSCLLSEDGDDFGFTIAATLSDKVTPIDPKIYSILMRLIETTLQGQTLEPAVDRMIAYGDAFCSLGLSKSLDRIEKVLFLPTWEMFRVENNKGQVLGFEQRRFLSDTNPIRFHPVQVVHWRYCRKNLYGRSLFYEAGEDWNNLKSATQDLVLAARSIGINPTLHIMPQCCDESYRDAFEEGRSTKAEGFYVSLRWGFDPT